ncbi:MAG: universal stress protein [Gemmatimonadota bacterium]
MAIPAMKAVGFCAHYSTQGDWAFEYALRLSREHELQLNVFHFLADPYDPLSRAPDHLSHRERTELIIKKERELRLYYDRLAGDYLEVGFRLCEDAEWTELHRCLLIREFQLLVLAYPERGASFAGRPLEEFADAFVCPVVLVGPEMPAQYHLNSPAALLADRLGVEGSWTGIELVAR